jgi:hypothetical protein
MNIERIKEVLQAGANSALEKMSSPRCLSKGEMTDLSFLELYARMVIESLELEKEIHKTITDYSDAVLSMKVLEAVRFEAGDVIAFASGLVAKADAEIAALTRKQPLLPGFDK